ncbi:EscS/YscS/HrcS family type III secretion system export apparatus protein [Ammoniphilus oxalaticus]|uniref:Flagellar biosynthetic protein FliQ n=1 Tax=Ammoniphilus oxalaticus TaxID=66863 RepID=A0A419SJP7_9BACL|nr:flagellar biosynthesis protein FliQ [Ammoniphilus oxalaticus]RKD24207.1 EscS/YscS/HrcS family type III secretion system export apparatus protein [Ammoniphilus oxalaticus]
MGSDVVLRIAENTVQLILMLVLPICGIALAVGLLVSIFQATTQIQEQTLAFVPKIIAVFLAILFFGSWMLRQLVDFSAGLLSELYRYIG